MIQTESVDLKRKLVFPKDVASLRPDMVLLSSSAENIIAAELTLHWEETLNTSQQLINEAVLKGWHATVFPVEVGCCGFPPKLVSNFFQRVGLKAKQLKKDAGDIATAAESSSMWLWLKMAHSWKPSQSSLSQVHR